MTDQSGPTAEKRLNQFLSVLSHLGWSLSAPGAPRKFRHGGRGIAGQAVWLALSLPDEHSLLLMALEEDLPSLSPCFKAYEDLTVRHRQIFRAVAEEGLTARYLLLLGHQGAHLIDRASEDILLAAEDHEEIDERLLPLLDLQSLSRGSLTAFPRKALRQRARELADWTQLWSARIGSKLDLTQGVMWRFFEWLHLARLAEENHVGPAHDTSIGDYALSAHSPDPKRFLDARLRPLHQEWFLLQEGDPETKLGIAARAAAEGLMADCLKSYSLLSSGKFSAEVFAEAFADEELRVLSWKSSVIASDLSGAEDEGTRWLYEAFEFDLDKQGCAVLLKRMDELTEQIRRFAQAQRLAAERGERVGFQMDLLAEAPPEIVPDEAPRFVLKHVLRVRTGDPARAALAKTLLLARACEWYRRYRRSELTFPPLQVDLSRQPEPPPPSDGPSLN
ncbi:hypothetical protein KQI84_01710 [bacterium]|nr:hypothetical protein [bacterium]